MKQLAKLTTLALALCITGIANAAHHENNITTYEMDSSGGTAKDHWVTYVSFDEKGDKTSGIAFAAVGKGDTLEAAYGITYTSRVGKTGVVSVKAANMARKGNTDGKTTVGIVKITEEQYNAAKKVLDEWKAKTEFGEDDTKASLTFSMNFMRVTGLKFPFAGLSTPHPLTYYGDISIINRKLGRKK
ncbi:MAG TPA: hypothetical protein EYN96_05205 [Candidatus Hydrogenedentes bacterium]|nr:hypothetical protein [Candidatus Hydrogenedentota bacterium]